MAAPAPLPSQATLPGRRWPDTLLPPWPRRLRRVGHRPPRRSAEGCLVRPRERRTALGSAGHRDPMAHRQSPLPGHRFYLYCCRLFRYRLVRPGSVRRPRCPSAFGTHQFRLPRRSNREPPHAEIRFTQSVRRPGAASWGRSVSLRGPGIEQQPPQQCHLIGEVGIAGSGLGEALRVTRAFP